VESHRWELRRPWEEEGKGPRLRRSAPAEAVEREAKLALRWKAEMEPHMDPTKSSKKGELGLEGKGMCCWAGSLWEGAVKVICEVT
jgi:hypothetical protein